MSKYNAGDKFVIEILRVEHTQAFPCDDIYKIKDTETYFTERGIDNLTKYIDHKRIEEDAINQIKQEAYEKGMNEAWEIARKITATDENVEISYDELQKMFPECDTGYIVSNIFSIKTPQEVKDKIEARENEEKNKIHVGDVVEYEGLQIIVTSVFPTNKKFDGIDKTGVAFGGKSMELWKKTGEHYNTLCLSALAGDANE